MSDLSRSIKPLDPLEKASLQRLMEMDVGFQLKLKQLEKRFPALMHSRMTGGSGLQLSKLLRWYFLEYSTRMSKWGPDSFPTSFNVVEAFMSFNPEYFLFELHDEVEHLLSINDYFGWYERNHMPKEPASLADIMTEGTIYSFEMVSDTSSFRITGESQQVLSGIAMVRHDYELSCILLAGENPPLHSDQVIMSIETRSAAPGREDMTPDPNLSVRDRYLEGYPDFAKVIVLTRFDLRAGKHDVRYVNLDNGDSFQILTDDTVIFADIPRKDLSRCQEAALNGLSRYDRLFSALASMIYLPAFFAAYPGEIEELCLTTELEATKDDNEVRKIIGEINPSEFVAERVIRCLSVPSEVDDYSNRLVEPPKLTFKSDGYWKPLGPLEIGNDQNGDPIVGRTWVSRHELWSAQSPQSFLLQRRIRPPEGPDPGVIYIQRSPSHEVNLYKVGLTRRTAQMRAQALSSTTSVPLPFGVLSNWDVGDCARVEREVHKRLAAFRVNPRREFFHAELSLISRTIEAVINDFAEEE